MIPGFAQYCSMLNVEFTQPKTLEQIYRLPIQVAHYYPQWKQIPILSLWLN
jgi:hypothetical protein